MRFHEIQRAPKGLRILLWVVLGVTVVFSAIIGFLQFSTDPDTTTADLLIMLFFVVVVPSGLVLWLNLVRQEVVIDDQGVSVQQKGLMLNPKVLPWEDIVSVAFRPVNAFGEFGGWGIRYGNSGRWGYILDGNYAIDLTLRSGKPRVITIVDGEGARAALRDRERTEGLSVQIVTEN